MNKLPLKVIQSLEQMISEGRVKKSLSLIGEVEYKLTRKGMLSAKKLRPPGLLYTYSPEDRLCNCGHWLPGQEGTKHANWCNSLIIKKSLSP